MGFALSWVAIRRKSPEAVLTELEWSPTGKVEGFPESQTTCTRLPNGWFAVIMQRQTDDFERIDLSRLSTGAELVTCEVEEHVMFSAAAEWLDGRKIWSVVHDAERGIRHLEIIGEPPPHLSAIVEQRSTEQDGGSEEAESTDFFFEVPVDLGEITTGYRYDQNRIGETPLQFEVLKRPPRARRSGGGWLKSILRIS